MGAARLLRQLSDRSGMSRDQEAMTPGPGPERKSPSPRSHRVGRMCTKATWCVGWNLPHVIGGSLPPSSSSSSPFVFWAPSQNRRSHLFSWIFAYRRALHSVAKLSLFCLPFKIHHSINFKVIQFWIKFSPKNFKLWIFFNFNIRNKIFFKKKN